MLNTRKHDATVNSTTLSGTALRDRNLNWSLQQSHSTQDGDSGGVNASYKALMPTSTPVTISRQIANKSATASAAAFWRTKTVLP